MLCGLVSVEATAYQALNHIKSHNPKQLVKASFGQSKLPCSVRSAILGPCQLPARRTTFQRLLHQEGPVLQEHLDGLGHSLQGMELDCTVQIQDQSCSILFDLLKSHPSHSST